jgi:hypothetical protein
LSDLLNSSSINAAVSKVQSSQAKALNKVVMVMCSQLTEAFNTRVRLFSRWMYVVKAAEEFVDNYTKAYFWTVAIKQWAMKTKTN